MKMLSSDVRGLVNCFLGFALVLLASFGRFPAQNPLIYVTTAFGLGLMIYSLLADHAAPGLAVSTRVLVELVAGFALAASPWIFGFSGVSWLPQVLVGLFVVGNSLVGVRLLRPRPDVRLGSAREPDGYPDTWSRLNRVR